MMDEALHDEALIRDEVIQAARWMLERGYMTGTAGNISARLGESSNLVITPSDTPYETLQPEDLALCSLQCERLSGAIPPSIELPMHAAIYCARPEARAIIHTHSLHAVAIALAGSVLPVQLEEAHRAIGSDIVACAPFAPIGSTRLAESAVATLGRDRKALLLAEHGTLAIGSTVQEAFTISEMIEKAAEFYLLSNQGSGSAA